MSDDRYHQHVEGKRKHPLADCVNCPLQGPENVFVEGYGPKDADIAIVGEAPGVNEAKQGKPFVGRSGKLLDQVLEQYGLDRDEFRITNTCLCRPPDNATPPSKAVKACSGRLESELRNCSWIVPLGNTAAQSILDTTVGITSLRAGPPKTVEKFPNAHIIPTIHPAACLYQPGNFPSLVADLGKLAEQTGGTEWIDPVYKVFDDVEETIRVLLELQQSDYLSIAVDIEVAVEKEDLSHPERYEFLCVGISYDEGKAIVIGEQAMKHHRVRARLMEVLREKDLICHNGKFDLAGLSILSTTGEPEDLYFDTMLASYVQDERPGIHGLKHRAGEVLGAPPWDQELHRYKGKNDTFDVIPRNVLYKYNAFDVVATYRLYLHDLAHMTDDEREVHDFMIEMSNALIYLEMDGMKIDIDYLDVLTDEFIEELDRQEEGLKKYVDNPRSPKQVKEALEGMGLLVDSTNEATLERLHDSGNAEDFTERMLKYRHDHKQYSTYVKGARKRLYKGRLHPTFLIHGTTTGRLACRNPNLHNVPRDSKIRNLYVPEQGNVFVQGDYAQAELRVVAELSGDEYLAEVLSDPDRDLMDEVTEAYFGPSFTKEDRVRGKAIVHGLNYGREAYSIAKEFRMPVDQAVAWRHSWFEMIPGVVAWQKEIKHKVLVEMVDLVSPFGRHRRFDLITPENQDDVIKEAYAFLPQSTATDITSAALIELRPKLHGSDARIRLPVHDSILVECKEGIHTAVGDILGQTMEDAARQTFTRIPFPVDVEVGHRWGELK